MAVKATFAADFSSFSKAVRDAELRLDDLETGANKAQQQLSRVGDAFSGSKVVQEATLTVKAIEALGGATKLTAVEQAKVNALVTEAIAKYNALGQAAPADMLALADATKQTETSWEKLGQIDVAGAITNPVGAAKQAVGLFGGEMAATVGIAAGVTAAVAGTVIGLGALTVAAAEADAELDDMADITGMSVPALSKLSNAAKVIGADMGTLTKGLFDFEKRLAEASPDFVASLEKMGYSLEQVRALKPDEYYPLITEGLSKITDQSEKAATAANLFGNSARELVPIVNDLGKAYEATANIAPVTAEEAEAAENFQIQLAALKVQVEAAGLAIGRVLVPAASALLTIFSDYVVPLGKFVADLTGLPGLLHTVAEAFRYATAAWDVFNKKMPDTSKMAASAEQGLEKTRKQVQDLALKVPDATAAFAEMNRVQKDLDATGKAHEEVLKKQKEAAEKAREEHERFTKSVTALTTSTLGFVTNWGVIAGQLPRNTQLLADAREEMERLTSSTNEFHDGISVAGDTVATVAIPAFATLPKVVAQSTEAIKSATTTTKTFSETMTAALSNLPNTLMAAFTGGGGISGALKAFGAELGGSLFGENGAFAKATASATKGLTNMFGKTIGSALGAAIPGIGALIGPGLQLLWGGIKKLFGGPSQAELEGRKTVQAFEQQLSGLLTATQRAEAGGRQWAATTIAVRDAFLATGRSAAEAEQVVLRLWDTKNPAAYKGAIDEINAAFKLQNDAFAALDEVVKRYGFTIEELGPAMQRQQLDQQAQQLYSDWQLLNSAGINTVAITTRMSDSVNEYIHNALKMGAEVPAAMKPMLDQMAKQGQLTDLAGNKIENLEDSGIDFSVTMTEGFKMMVESVDKLTNVIAKSLNVAIDDTAAAIASIPTDVTVNIHYNDPGLPVHEVPVAEVSGFQKGTGGRFINFGKGALAMLHGREAIVPEGQAAGMNDEHLAGLRQDITELKNALLAEQRLAPERLGLALRGVLALAR